MVKVFQRDQQKEYCPHLLVIGPMDPTKYTQTIMISCLSTFETIDKELTFGQAVLDVQVNETHLVILLEERIHIHALDTLEEVQQIKNVMATSLYAMALSSQWLAYVGRPHFRDINFIEEEEFPLIIIV